MNLSEALEAVDKSSAGEKISFGEIIGAFDHRGYGPLLMVVSLFIALPTGAIPGAPIIASVLIVLIAGQLLIGQKTPWIPKRLREISFEKSQWEKNKEKIKPYTQKIDKLFHPRLKEFSTTYAPKLIAVVAIILGLLMPLIGLVPFAILLPASALIILSLGLSTYDGLVIVIGLAVTICTLFAAAYWFL